MSAAKKFVVWDWNGTLLDDTEIVRACVNQVLGDLQKPQMDMETFRDLQTRPLRNFYLAAGMSEGEVDLALEGERNVFQDKYEDMADNAPLRDGAVDLLKKLSANDVDNVILSNHVTDQIIRLLDLRGIHGYFGDVIAYPGHGREYRTVLKGEKLRAFIAERGLTAANAVIIGDTVEEIEIARELGMASIAITGGIHSESRLRALNPDHVVHDIAAIDEILRERGFA